MISAIGACGVALFGSASFVHSLQGKYLLPWGGKRFGRWFDAALYASLVLLTVGFVAGSIGWWIAWGVCLVLGVIFGLTPAPADRDSSQSR